jgi:hypothetical protein
MESAGRRRACSLTSCSGKRGAERVASLPAGLSARALATAEALAKAGGQWQGRLERAWISRNQPPARKPAAKAVETCKKAAKSS